MAYSVCHAPLKLCEVLLENHTMEKCHFLKPIVHSKIIYFSVFCKILEYSPDAGKILKSL